MRPRALITAVTFCLLAMVTAVAVVPAYAHVKWFAPYIVEAQPSPLNIVLQNQWMWAGIALVLIFFVATRLVEISTHGTAVSRGLNRCTGAAYTRLDDYIRAVVAAFFVAIFAVGGVYLTPDLKTDAEWVSWMQLVIAAAIFSRRTMPLAGVGIAVLWLLAVRDYDLFHLLDYLALGLAVAGYLILEPMKNEDWRSHRFEVLRWGLAIALMWSSLEKFAYPEWFHPLVTEKPFLTLGLPRDVFIPMAGVAEFTMGFGLLWTPLIRRLSAIALLIIFTAAVWPFGRIDLVGHGLIMAILVAIASDQCSIDRFLPRYKQKIHTIPLALFLTLGIFICAYWGIHAALYDYTEPPTTVDRATHSHNPEHPHGPKSDTGMGAPPTKR